MIESEPQKNPRETHGKPEAGHGGPVVQILEHMDNWAHVIVAAFFILMAATVIVHMGFIFLRQLPLIIPATPAPETSLATKSPHIPDMTPLKTQTETSSPSANAATKGASEEGGSGFHALKENGGAAKTMTPGGITLTASDGMGKTLTASTGATGTIEPKASEAATDAPHHKTENAEDPFVRNSLELLSNILFAVILLELLRTIITYLQTHDIQAIMQEFLVVGIISSVRKILLVGAEASLVGSKNQMEFIQEASGVVINILGILLLILGLVMLRRAYSNKAQ